MTDEPEEDNSAQISEWLVGQLLKDVVPDIKQPAIGTEGWPEPEKEPEPEPIENIEHDELTTEANFDNNDVKSERESESPINIYSLSNAADLMVDSVLVSILAKTINSESMINC
jgi:hypothetical protein